MELSNAKVLIASDGEKTFVLVNGTPLIGDKIDFKSDMCGVRSVCLMPCLHLTCTKPVTLPHL